MTHLSNPSPKHLKIALVAGEASGDALGAGLMQELQKNDRYRIEFIGIGGDNMREQGLVSLFDMQELSVMGLFEVLARLPRLLSIRRHVIRTLLGAKPDVFIGIDAPDFNLGVEKKLKQAGIKTVHYVSPSVWAWRQNRIKTIKQASDLILSLLPFEKQFYDAHHVPCTFVGHRLAEQIPVVAQDAQKRAQATLSLDPHKTWIAFLPGSRLSEIKHLAPVFLKACQIRYQQDKRSAFLVPLIHQAHVAVLQAMQAHLAPEIPIFYFVKDTRTVIKAADVVVLASGTATLETMLLKKPMVVGYRLHRLTYQFAKYLVKVPYIALPNLLANAPVVPELIQAECSPEKLVHHIDNLLRGGGQRQIAQFEDLHRLISRGADQHAAQAVFDLIQ